MTGASASIQYDDADPMIAAMVKSWPPHRGKVTSFQFFQESIHVDLAENEATMHLPYATLMVVILVTFVGRGDALSKFTDAVESEDTPLASLNGDDIPAKRFLRRETTMSNLFDAGDLTDEERDVGATKVFSTAVSAMKAKAKLTIMLGRGFSPAKAMKKLNIKNLKDKKFNSFSRYYAKYLAKYPKKAAKLPATAEDAAMAVKMKEWLGQKVLPPRIPQKLQEFGQKDVKTYATTYMKMWGENQAKLSAKVKTKRA